MRNKRAMVGARHQINFFKIKRIWTKCYVCYWCSFIWLGDMSDMLYVHCYALTLICDSALPFADQVRIHFHFGYSLCMFWFSYVHDSFRVFIIFLIRCHDCFILLVETHFRDLEGCYGFYRTFLISNLTPEPDPVFCRSPFPN